MAGKVRPIGPSSSRVAENLRVWRRRRKLTTPQLEARLSNLGQPILESGLSRIEGKIRRVDVDDLVALACVLDISPLSLLAPSGVVAPVVDKSAVVEVTPNYSAPLGDFYAWLLGDRPLGDPGRPGYDEADFLLWNKPTRFAMQAPITQLADGGTDVPALKLVAGMARLVYEAIRAGIPTETIRVAFEQSVVAALNDKSGIIGQAIAQADDEPPGS